MKLNIHLIFIFISVIDYCLTKNLVTDTNTNFISLRLDWAARSNCRQRAGRTGRVMSGRCYRFVTRSFYEVGFIYVYAIEFFR